MAESSPLHTDACIIGAGPVGLFAVFQCGMVRIKCHVVDALDAVGGQCAALYPEKPIYDVPAHPSILAGDLIDTLEAQAAPFHPTYHLGQQVTGLTRQDNGRWLLETSKGTHIDCAVVIVAAGAGAFGPNRPPLDGLEQYEGTSVFYFVKSREAFRNKRVVIAGGGDSAVDWALSLADIAASVSLIHRRPKFRCAPESAARLKELSATGKIDLVVPYQLHSLHGNAETGTLSTVRVADLDGNTRDLDADVLLPFFGLATSLGPISEWGLGMEKNHITITQGTSATSAEGIFAAGDVCTYPGKLKLILTGFAEVAQAAHHAYPIVHKGEALHFEHSTSMGAPGVA
jgi:thioredoxin reductase (NADPH)